MALLPGFIFMGVFGILLLSHEGSLDANDVTYAFWQRIFYWYVCYLVYVVKSVVPWRMSPLYPYPPSIPAYFYPTILVLPAVLFWDGRHLWKTGRYLGFRWPSSLSTSCFCSKFSVQVKRFYCRQVYLYRLLWDVFWFWLSCGIGFRKNKTDKFLSGCLRCVGHRHLCNLDLQAGGYLGELGYVVDPCAKILQPDDPGPLETGANFYRSQKCTTKRWLTTTKPLNSKDPQTFNSGLVCIFDTATDSTRLMLALRDYNKAIELKPDDGEFWVNRATYADLAISTKQSKISIPASSLSPTTRQGIWIDRFWIQHWHHATSLAVKNLEIILHEP